ncbi:MAG: PLDc N-terminal domain-containing protein [Tepidisphaeraceae bacterium]
MHPILYLLALILDIVAIVQIVQSDMDGTKKAVWIIIILFLPYLGILLWFFLGKK